MFRPKTPIVPSSTTANALATTTTSVNVSNAVAPSVGKTLQAESGTAASWQNARLLNVKLSGAVGDDMSFDTTALATNDTAALAAGLVNYFPKGTYKVSGTVVFSAPCIFDVGAIIHVTAGSITFNGGVTAEITQILDLESGVTASFNPLKTIVGYAEWFGAVPDDVGTDCTTALNACLASVIKTQLMFGKYYCSGTIYQAVDNSSLVGAAPLNGWWFAAEDYSAICSTSNSATVLSVTALLSPSGKNFSCTRNIAPLISSACIGVRITPSSASWGLNYENVVSNESMVGWRWNDAQWAKLIRCRAHRSRNGTGGGTDTFKGFWCDGQATGSASFYNVEPFVQINSAYSTYTGTSYAYYFSGAYRDSFNIHPECYGVTYAAYIVGGSTLTMDIRFTSPVFEAIKECLYITGHTESLQIDGGHFFCKGTTTPLVTVTGSTGSVKLNGLEYNVNQASTYPYIQVTNSKGVDSANGVMYNPKGAPVVLNGSSNCRFTDAVFNNSNTGAPVSLTNSSRNEFAMKMYGTYARAKGYDVTDALSGYNEFNCSGIDPACITGGAANKLVINGTQVVAVGIAAAGHGTNVASGVMA